MPPELERLLKDILGSIADQNVALAAGRISVNEWQEYVARDIYVGHLAATMVGRGTKDLGASKDQVLTTVGEQLDYLNKFADQIEREGWREAFGARALMYGGSIRSSFWQGRTFGLVMPYVPGDGSTPCLSNCRCHLEIDWLDQEELDADIIWHLGSEQHCTACPDRAAQSPYRFRGGELQ